VSQLVALPGGGQLDLSKIPAGERERVMAGLERVLEANPLDRFFPHEPDESGREPQREFLAARTPIVAVFAGNQFGKTTAGVIKDLIDCLDRELVPAHLRGFKRWDPPFYCRMILPNGALVESSILPAVEEWCPPAALVGGCVDKAYREGPPRRLRFKNGSYIEFMSSEQKTTGDKKVFGSVRLHRVHYDEEPPKLVRQESVKRLYKFGGDELFTMTPQDGLGWTYREIWKKRGEAHITAVVGDTEMNAANLDRDALERDWASMSEEELAYRKRGEFIHVGGFAYPLMPDRVVEAPRPGRLKGQDIVVGIDPGIRFAGLTWTGFDTDNVAVTFDELLLREATAPDYAEQIRRVNAKWGIQDPTYVIDPSARNRGLAGGESIEAELARYDIMTVPGWNDRQAGVMQIRRRLAHGGLYISKDCRGLLDEAEDYVLVERPDGSWEPEKGNDHRLDALRYSLVFRPWLAERAAPEKRGYQPGYEPAWAPMPPVAEAPMGPMS
jgi:hypothetical protein